MEVDNATRRSTRQIVSLGLLAAAVAFGMVLAGGMQSTPAGIAADDLAPSAGEVVSSSEPLEQLPSFADLAEAALPAVVPIHARSVEEVGQLPFFDPFEFFFGPRERQERPRERRLESAGSGFLISGDGLLVTNNHVVEGADRVSVQLGGRSYEAEIVGTDPPTDLALLKIGAGHGLRYLRLGDSDELRIGDWVMAMGNPLQLGNTVTVGVVSAKGRGGLRLLDPSFENFIQTDAAINRGNSGGPLLNRAGEVVGIATAMNWGAQNIGFAIPVNMLKAILPQLQETGAVRRGYLGVGIDNLDYEAVEAFPGLERPEGALVESVQPGTPAEEAGLKHGDIVLQVDGRAVRDTRDLIDYISAQPPGTEVTLRILREGQRLDKQVTLGERGEAPDGPAPREEPRRPGLEWLGITYSDIGPRARQQMGIPDDVQGVLVADVQAASPLADRNLRRGDLIVEANGQAIRDAKHFEELVSGVPSGSMLRLYVQRYDPRSPAPASTFIFVRVP